MTGSTRPKVVLLVDNLVDAVEAGAAQLRQHGYTVLGATSPASALEQVRDRWLHLVVIDLRLADDDNLLDYGGAELARNPALQIYPRIIYTAFPSFEAIKQLNERFGKQLPDGVLIESKKELSLIEVVEQAFRIESLAEPGHVGINFSQRLEYTDRPNTRALVSMLEDLPDDGMLFTERVREVEDLFGKAFVDCELLTISLLAQGRRSGFVLIVTRQRNGTTLKPLIVKCGDRALIQREFHNYQTYVRDSLYRTARLDDRPTETLHFGLLKYDIADGDIANTLTFADFYRQQSGALIKTAIQNLIREAEGPWHVSDQIKLHSGSLYRFYEDRLLFQSRKSTVDLPTRWAQIGAAVRQVVRGTPPQIRIREQDQQLIWMIGSWTIALPEPFAFLSGLRAQVSPQASYLKCPGHGDLHAENIRVDDDARIWLIDFEHSGWGPLLQDAVELESSIRFGLLQERQLERRLRFEEALAGQHDLRTPPTPPPGLAESADLLKAFEAITVLRQEIGRLEGAELGDYLLGLIYQALRIIKHERPRHVDINQLAIYKVHALFVAAVCCRQLQALRGPQEGAAPAPGTLYV